MGRNKQVGDKHYFIIESSTGIASDLKGLCTFCRTKKTMSTDLH